MPFRKKVVLFFRRLISLEVTQDLTSVEKWMHSIAAGEKIILKT
jgi:hypothetical protein